MSMTKEQWAEFEKKLSVIDGEAQLVCDGYSVNFRVVHIAPLKLGIRVFVNGVFRGEWAIGKAEESKFLRRTKHYLYPAKKRKEMKEYSAKKCKRFPELQKHYEESAETHFFMWSPYWTSSQSLSHHLRKTCTDIQVVKIGYTNQE